ncbi:unnamed protein product [Acanthoscelides obtectus]|uniref:Uncharacterized protein n=1 Tax=Acanthoscelides obtectus TaxID=200917 RepID=A0A9P0LV98_ACAOB|nr:unnamed protein product [Acanthoscelides obtectus]CAK1664097.1 hypothetical protein AOBTE_LOCUS24049 [Acanthoscelides obtectus]
MNSEVDFPIFIVMHLDFSCTAVWFADHNVHESQFKGKESKGKGKYQRSIHAYGKPQGSKVKCQMSLGERNLNIYTSLISMHNRRQISSNLISARESLAAGSDHR